MEFLVVMHLSTCTYNCLYFTEFSPRVIVSTSVTISISLTFSVPVCMIVTDCSLTPTCETRTDVVFEHKLDISKACWSIHITSPCFVLTTSLSSNQ